MNPVELLNGDTADTRNVALASKLEYIAYTEIGPSSSAESVRPVLFLKYSIQVIIGTGTQLDPYMIQ